MIGEKNFNSFEKLKVSKDQEAQAGTPKEKILNKKSEKKESKIFEIKDGDFWSIVFDKMRSIVSDCNIDEKNDRDNIVVNTVEALYIYIYENELNQLGEDELDWKLHELFQKERKLIANEYFTSKRNTHFDGPVNAFSKSGGREKLFGEVISDNEATVLEKMIEAEEIKGELKEEALNEEPAPIRLEKAYIQGSERQKKLSEILKDANLNDLSIHELELLSRYFMKGDLLKGRGQWQSQDVVKAVRETMLNERKGFLVNIGLRQRDIEVMAMHSPAFFPVSIMIKQFNNLSNLGFKDPIKIIRGRPQVLGMPEKIVSEKIEFIEKIGIDEPLRLIEMCPRLLGVSVDKMADIVRQFENMGISDIPKFVKRSSSLLASGNSPERLMQRLNYLKDQGMENPLRFIEKNPFLIGCNFEEFQKKIVNLKKIGFREPMKVIEKSASGTITRNIEAVEKRIATIETMLRFFEKKLPEMKDIHAVDLVESNPSAYLAKSTAFLKVMLQTNVFLHTYFSELFETKKSKWQTVNYHGIGTFNRLINERADAVILAVKDLIIEQGGIHNFSELMNRIESYKKKSTKDAAKEVYDFIALYDKQIDKSHNEKSEAFMRVLSEYQKYIKEREKNKAWVKKLPKSEVINSGLQVN